MQQISLTQLINQSMEYLIACEYSQHTIRHYSTVWKSLERYSKKKGTNFYTLDFGMDFIVNHYGVNLDSKLSKHHVSIIRSIRMLHDIQQVGYAKRIYTNFSPKITLRFINIYDLYKQQQKEQGLSNRTITNKTMVLNNLLLFLENSGMTDISGLKPSHVYAFLESLQSYAGSTREKILYSLRDVLHFLVKEGFSKQELAGLFPVISTQSEDPIPSVYSTDEITRILECVDRESKVGKEIMRSSYLLLDLGCVLVIYTDSGLTILNGIEIV